MKKLSQICLLLGLFFVALVDSSLANQADCIGRTYCLGIKEIYIEGEKISFDEVSQAYIVDSDFDIFVVGACREWMGTAQKTYITVSIKNGTEIVKERTRRLDAMQTGGTQERKFHFEDVPSGEYDVYVLIRNRGYTAKGEEKFKIKKGI